MTLSTPGETKILIKIWIDDEIWRTAGRPVPQRG
jgi:hypothetical protein